MAPKTFTNWKECCKYLFELIGKNKVLAGSNTLIEDTGSGIRVHAQAGGSGGSNDEYKGPFAIVDNGDDTFKCVNNALSDAAQTAFPAGVVYFGYYTRSVAALLDIPTDNIVWLESKYDGSDYVSELKSGSELPEYVEGVNIYVVGITGASIDQQLRDNCDLKWVLV